MDNCRFSSDFDDLAMILIWLPALVIFVPVVLISACVVLPVAFVGNLAFRALDHVRTAVRNG